MKRNRELIITCSIIALSILTIDIILTMLAGLDTLLILLSIIFTIAIIGLIIYKSKHTKKSNKRKSVIANIEDTIVLRLEEINIDSIAPVRNEEELIIKDDEPIKEDLEIQRENHITKELIEEELSKTIFINDLKDKMKLYEIEHEKIKEQEEAEELKKFQELIKDRKND